MADVKIAYGSADQTITVTIASLGSGSARESTAINNTTPLMLDALVQVMVHTNGSGTSANGYVSLYVYGSIDGASTYSGGATGSDAAITLTSPPNHRLLGTITANANNTSYKSALFSVAAAFGGVLPARWGIIVDNQTGAALNSTGGNHKASYQGVYQTVA